MDAPRASSSHSTCPPRLVSARSSGSSGGVAAASAPHGGRRYHPPPVARGTLTDREEGGGQPPRCRKLRCRVLRGWRRRRAGCHWWERHWWGLTITAPCSSSSSSRCAPTAHTTCAHASPLEGGDSPSLPPCLPVVATLAHTACGVHRSVDRRAGGPLPPHPVAAAVPPTTERTQQHQPRIRRDGLAAQHRACGVD